MKPNLHYFQVDSDSVNSLELLQYINQTPLNLEFDSEAGLFKVEVSDETISELSNFIQILSKYTTIQEYSTSSIEEKLEDKNLINELMLNFSNLSDVILKNLYKLSKSINYAVFDKRTPETTIAEYFIRTATKEIDLQYHDKDIVKYEIGDIVLYQNSISIIDKNNIGKTAIVCHKNNDMVFLVPVLIHSKSSSENELQIFSRKDVIFNDTSFLERPYKILFEYGRFMNEKRILDVIGKSTPEFLEKVRDILQRTFDFRNSEEAISPKPVDSANESISRNLQQDALFEEFGEAFKKLSETGDLNHFLSTLNIQDELLKEVCFACYDLKKITIITISQKMDKPTNKFKNSLRQAFNEWLEQYPNLKALCSNFSFIELLKAIQKSMNQ